MPRLILADGLNTEYFREILSLFYGPVVVIDNQLSAGTDERVYHVHLSRPSSDPLSTVLNVVDAEQVYTQALNDKVSRQVVGRAFYHILVRESGVFFPWGALIGVRPTQVAWKILERVGTAELAINSLIQDWGVSLEKAEKCVKVGMNEDKLLTSLRPDDYMAYVGIPFCPGRCSYCSFIARDALRQAEWLSPYTDALLREATTVFNHFSPPISALYVGGGTPTSLDNHDFERMLSGLRRIVPMTRDAEFTVEAGRPDSINDYKLQVMKDCGVNRICINPQTMRDGTLAKLGRLHSTDDVLRSFAAARKLGFAEINMDLIMGLPDETIEDFKYSLERLIELGPEAITIHSLSLKRSAQLHEEQDREDRRLLLPDAKFSEALRLAEQRLAEEGYEAYYLYRQKNTLAGLENTGYSRGRGCIYNVGMMSDRVNVIGIGSGSSSKKVRGTRVTRLHNSKDIRDYTLRADEFAEKTVELYAD